MKQQSSNSALTSFFRESVQSLSQLLEVVAAQPASAAQGSLVRGLIRDISILSQPQASTQELEEIRDRTLNVPSVLRQAGPTCFPPVRQAALATGETLGRYVNAQSLANARTLLSGGKRDEVLRSLMWVVTAPLPADAKGLQFLLDIAFDDADLEGLRQHSINRLGLLEAREEKGLSAGEPVLVQESAQPTKRYFITRRDGAPLGEKQRIEVREAILSLGQQRKMKILSSELNIEGRFAVARLPDQLQQHASESWADLRFEEDILLSTQHASRRELKMRLIEEGTGAVIPGVPVTLLAAAGARNLRFDHRGLLVARVIGDPGLRVEISPEHSFWSHCLEWPDSVPGEEVPISLTRLSVSAESWWRREIGNNCDGRHGAGTEGKSDSATGEGVHIALIDTGFAPHRDLNLYSGGVCQSLVLCVGMKMKSDMARFVQELLTVKGGKGAFRGLLPAPLCGVFGPQIRRQAWSSTFQM